MAKKNETKITRISASDANTDRDGKKQTIDSPKKEVTPPRKTSVDSRGTPLSYFKGAWYELRQVRWPTRRATWGLTGAVLGFSAFFVVFILLIDAFFQYVFQLIIK